MPDPLFHSEPQFSPADLGRLTGVSPDMQRDWRRRGYIDNIGTMQENGRWLYDWADALFLCVAQRVYSSGIELTLALRTAVSVAPFVMFQAQHQWGIFSHPSREKRFFRVFKSALADAEMHGGWAAESIRSLEDAGGQAAFIIIDAHLIARALPEDFKPAMTKAMEITIAELARRRSE